MFQEYGAWSIEAGAAIRKVSYENCLTEWQRGPVSPTGFSRDNFTPGSVSAMCGIAGFTHWNRKPDPHLIRRMTEAISHRGPDQSGIFSSSQVSLGAVRLRIQDLQEGDQPLICEDGGAVIVFNGEIYNHAELRRTLEAHGHRFQTKCDTEVVLLAFRQWDVECFARLRGMFALAVWIPADQRLVLARDRLGIKPLYLHRRGDNLFFGSELKTILEDPGVRRTLDLAALNYYLSLNYVPGTHTLIEGLEKLPPGHWMEWRDGRMRSESYWRLQFRQRPRTLGAAMEELDQLLQESVREHLVSDVPLGIWASGGLDSSTILHYAAAASPSRLKTFSISFRGHSFDETRYFRQMAEHFGTEHYEFDVSPEQDLASSVEQMSYYSDEPSADSGALPVWYLSRMSREHVTVALSGEGADELLGGYITYQADRWNRRMRRLPVPLRKLLRRGADLWPLSDDKISLEYKLKRFLRGSLLPPDEAHCFWNGTFSTAEKKSFFPAANGLGDLFRQIPEEAKEQGWLNRHLWFDQTYYLPDDILYKVDRMSMAHSLEVRPPFLDHRIVEFAASLPESFKIRGGTQKVVLRELMRPRLPEGILGRKKEGLDIPTHEWFRTTLRPLLMDTLTPGAIERAEVFQPKVVFAMICDHLARRANFGFQLWGLLTLFLWMHRWNIVAPKSVPDRQSSAPVLTPA
jgi:asparagine synthase (glutamine-hydrolysing)